MIFHYTIRLILIGLTYYFFPRFLIDSALYGRAASVESIKKKLKFNTLHAERERMRKLHYAQYFLFLSACAFFFCFSSLEQDIWHMNIADQMRAHSIACISAAMIWHPVTCYIENISLGRTVLMKTEILYSLSIIGGILLCIVGVILW